MASHTHTDLDQKKSLRAFRQTSKPTTIELVGGIYCDICQTTYPNKKDYDNHYAQHKSGVEVVYTCVVCHKQMTSYPSFRGHCYTTHVIKDKYKCEHCSKYFSSIISLKEHIKVTHTFKCSTCSKQFTSKNELQLHQIIHNNSESPPYHCQVCEVKISTLDGCKDHIDMHTVFIYFCPICNENISSRDKAAEHLKKHFDDCNDENVVEAEQNSNSDETSVEQLGGISCNYCTTKFKNRVEFDAHFSCEHGDKDIVYICVACDKKFEKYSVFFDHVYNHSTKDKFCCSICLKTFGRLSLLVAHMTACQSDSEASGKPFACHQCDRRYGTDMRLRQHLQEAHGQHRIVCPVDDCHKTFASRKDFIFHQYVHNSQQNWCRQCGMPFVSLSACERHLDVHKKKFFGCPVCNRNYGEKYLLTNHINQHFESIVHMCKVCGNVYNVKRRFMDHLKTHSETKFHNCTYCGKGFPNLHRLQQHLNTHTGSKPYKCTICSKTFASYPNWLKHKRRMHNIAKCRKIAENHSDEIIDDTEIVNENAKPHAVNMQDLNVDTVVNNEMLLVNPHVDLKMKTFTFDTQDVMEPECIDPIEIEKELQILENYQMTNPTTDAELVDVLSAVGPIFDDGTSCPQPSVPVEVIEPPIMDEHSAQPINYPPEYGPEFTVGDGSGFLDLDDHMLPHIDPLLTIKTEEYNMANGYQALLPAMDPGTYEVPPNWEPPIFTKVCPDYSYVYGDMVDANRLSMMNTDIF